MTRFIFILLFILLPFEIHAKAASAIKELEKNGGIISPTSDGGLRIEFQLSGRDLNDEGLEPIKSLESVKILNLRDTKITNAGIIHIEGIL